MMNDALLTRIRKLLALASNNPSEEEAASAALKAQKLMAEYGLDEAAIGSGEHVGPGTTTASVTKKPWRGRLAAIIARNFRCEAAIAPGGIVFFGYPSDREIAKSVFATLYKMGNELGRKAVGYYHVDYPRRTTSGVFETYIAGFCDGISHQLGIQAKALMVVVPEEVTKYAANLVSPGRASKAKRMSKAAKTSGAERLVYLKGVGDGCLAVSTRLIEGGSDE